MDYDKLKKRWFLEKLERKRISDEIKSSVISKGIPLFKRFGIHKVVLFGSVIDGRSGKNSDIDILVIPLSGDRYWPFRHELEQSLGYPLDLYTQDDDNKFIEKILERGDVIYEV